MIMGERVGLGVNICDDEAPKPSQPLQAESHLTCEKQ